MLTFSFDLDIRSGTTTHLSPNTKVTFDKTQNLTSNRATNPLKEPKATSQCPTAIRSPNQSYQAGFNSRHRRLAENKKLVVADITSPVARRSSNVNGLMLVGSMNTPSAEKSLKAARYQPSEKDISLSNHNKSDMTLISPRANKA